MPIEGITQPDCLVIDDTLRLVNFNTDYKEDYLFILPWYQDLDTVWLFDGDRIPYTPELLTKMFDYLNASGELYIIEVWDQGEFRPIGDITFSVNDLPVVIWDPKWRGRGIVSRLLPKLIERARTLGFQSLEVEEIYDWNLASQKLFRKFGFRPVKKTKKGQSYRLEL